MNSYMESFFAQIDRLQPSLAQAAKHYRDGQEKLARKEVIRVIRRRWKDHPFILPRLDLCGELAEQADLLLKREVILLNRKISLDVPVNWLRLAETDGQRNWHLGYHYWLNALAHAYASTGDLKYARQWKQYVEEFLDGCPYARDPRGYWPTQPMVLNDRQTCNLGENGGPQQHTADKDSQSQWMSLSCHFRIETWLGCLSRLVDCEVMDDAFFVRVLDSLLNDHAYVCIMNPRENTPNQFTAVTLSLLKLALAIPEYRPAASYFLVAWERFQRVLSNNLFPDGSDLEHSPDYNCFLLDNCLEVLEILDHAGAPDSRKTTIRNAARQRLRFLVGILFPDGTLPPIGKAHAENKQQHFLKLARMLKDDDCLNAIENNEGPLRQSLVYPYGGYYCLRQPDTQLLFKASRIGSGHMHEDALSFILWADGRAWLIDPSHYTYDNAPGEETQLNEYALSSLSHNTVTIGSHGQNRMAVRKEWPRRDEEVPHLRASEQRKLPFRACGSDLVAVLEGLYEDGFGENAKIKVQHRRTIFQLHQHGWLIVDSLSGDSQDHALQQHWHLPQDISPDQVTFHDDQDAHVYDHQGRGLRLARLDPVACSPQLKYGQLNPVGGWVFPHYGVKAKAPEIVWESGFEAQHPMLTWIETGKHFGHMQVECHGNRTTWCTTNGLFLSFSHDENAYHLDTGKGEPLHWPLNFDTNPGLPAIC